MRGVGICNPITPYHFSVGTKTRAAPDYTKTMLDNFGERDVLLRTSPLHGEKTSKMLGPKILRGAGAGI